MKKLKKAQTGGVPLKDFYGKKVTSEQDATKVSNDLIPKSNSNKDKKLATQKLANNQNAIVKDKYYNPPVKKGITSGDARIDFLYNNQWLMDVPLVGDYIKEKAYEVAKNSGGIPIVDDTKEFKETRQELIDSGQKEYTGGYTMGEPLLDQYFGKVELPDSKYKPTSDYLPFLPSKSVKEGSATFYDGYDMSQLIKDVVGNDNKGDYSKPIYKSYKEFSLLSHYLNVNLAGHKQGVAFDKKRNLPYLSISDAWDFEPQHYSKKWQTQADDNKNADKSYIQSSLMHKAGKSFKVYDRFYFDPKTNKYISDDDIDALDKGYTVSTISKKQKGGAITNTGYLSDSPDRFNDYNIIPSNQITMKGVKHPVYGVDELGNEQMMYPGSDYTFPGSYVTEYPMKKKINKKQFGGEDNLEEGVTPFYSFDPGYNPNMVTPTNSGTQPPSKTQKPKWTKNQFNKVLSQASSGIMNQFTNPTSFYNIMGTAADVAGYFDNNRKERVERDRLLDTRLTDNLYPTLPSGSGSRGDYVQTGTAYGQFRPDQLGAKSPYGTTGTYFQKGGSFRPTSKQDTIYTNKGNMVTTNDMVNLKKNGLSFDSMAAYGDYLDLWASPVPQANVPNRVGIVNPAYNISRSPNTLYQYDSPDYHNITGQRTGPITAPILPTILAKQEYGGQTNYALDLNGSMGSFNTSGDQNMRSSLAPVDRDLANIEAELGETIYGDFDGDGMNEHMKIGGKRHSQGGTPISAPQDAFVFSDTRKMAIGGDILKEFGKSEKSKKKYTPADLAKQYDINKYKDILADVNADPMKLKTAEMMINNYEDKLAKLALVQESHKGFPNGIPSIALNYLNSIQTGVPSGGNTEEEVFMRDGGSIPRYDVGGYNPNEIITDPYKGGKTPAGATTPTGINNAFNRRKDYLDQWDSIIPGVSKLPNKQAQALIYDYTLKNNPDAVRDMWATYGNTAQGLKNKDTKGLSKNGKFSVDDLNDTNLNKLKNAYTDGYFGVRQLDPTKGINTRNLDPVTPPRLDSPYVKPDAPNLFPNGPGSPKPGLRPNDPNYVKGQNPTSDYWMQDKINVLAGARNSMNLQKYLPWEAPITGVQADPTFYDPNRELANNNELANTEMMYENQFAGPQGASYRNSAVAGQSAEQAANILSKYNNMNVGAANQFSQMNAQFTNALTAAQGQRANSLYRGTTIADQQYDNSKTQAEEVIRKNVIGAIDNKQKAQWLNTWYPQYNIDPSNGSMNFMNNGYKGITAGSGSSAGATNYIETYLKLKQQYPNASEEVLREQAKQLAGVGRQTIENDGDARATVTGPIPQQLLNQFKF